MEIRYENIHYLLYPLARRGKNTEILQKGTVSNVILCEHDLLTTCLQTCYKLRFLCVYSYKVHTLTLLLVTIYQTILLIVMSVLVSCKETRSRIKSVFDFSKCTVCPQKTGILDSNLNFKKNIKQKNYCLCLFESLLIQLSIGKLCFKFKLVSEKLYTGCIKKSLQLENSR